MELAPSGYLALISLPLSMTFWACVLVALRDLVPCCTILETLDACAPSSSSVSNMSSPVRLYLRL